MSQTTVRVIQDEEAAASLLQPLRRRILLRLREPDSAAAVARSLRVPRQRLGYHVRILEDQGLLRRVGERPAGNMTETLLQSSARHFVISPAVVRELQLRPDQLKDRFSSAYAVASAARTVAEVSTLRERAEAAGKKLATLTLEAEVRFACPADQHAFAAELTRTLANLTARFHTPCAASGRTFRFALTGHPTPPSTPGES
jgi:DNA-binding transcriptional ArsR family regulator